MSIETIVRCDVCKTQQTTAKGWFKLVEEVGSRSVIVIARCDIDFALLFNEVKRDYTKLDICGRKCLDKAMHKALDIKEAVGK